MTDFDPAASAIWKDTDSGMPYNPLKNLIRDWAAKVEAGVTTLEAAVAALQSIGMSGYVLRESVVAATTGNVALTGAYSVDGVTVTNGQRYLAWKQTDPAENGVYVYNSAGAHTRATDMAAAGDVQGSAFAATGGATYEGWILKTESEVTTLDTDDVEFYPAVDLGSIVTAVNNHAANQTDAHGATSAGMAILKAANAAAQRTSMGLGTASLLDGALLARLADPAFTGTPTAPTAVPGTDTTQIATTAFAQALATALVDGAPGDLDTLNKIAASIGDDADFATTMANALALKAPLASPALTGTPTAPTAAPDTDSTQIATAEFVARALLKANRLPLGLPFTLAGEDGRVPFRVDDDGSVNFGNFGFLSDQKVLGAGFAIEDDAGQIALAILAAGAVAIGRAEVWSMPPLGPALILEGEDGQAPLVVDLDGQTDLVTSGNGDSSETNPRAVLRPDQATRDTPDIVGLNHVLMSGQSLSVAGNTAYSDAQVDSNDVTFSGGIDISTAYTGNTLVPHPTIGDAQIARCAISQLKYLIQTDPDLTAYKMLTSAHGASGQPIAALDKGSSAFANGMHQVEEGARLADAASLIHQVQALMWVQGHADAATALATYKADLRQMLDDYHADIEAITGQSWEFPLIAYQGANEQTNVGGSSEYEPVVARAIYEMSADHDDIIAAVPSYHVTYSDGTHMVGDSYQHIGQHIGRVLYAVLIRGEEWTGLRPREVRAYRSDEVLVRFHVPVAPLVFDTSAVSDPGNYGFEVRDDDGTPAITSVSIVGDDTVRIKLDRDLAANATLAYAWYTTAGTDAGPGTGPRGCLFDSDTTEAYQRGNSLANPCLRFKEAIS